MNDLREIFGVFQELFRLSAEAEIRKRAARKEKRKANARRRYAARKAAGTLPKRKKPEPEYEREAPTSCYCQHTNPPCSWCVSEPLDDDV